MPEGILLRLGSRRLQRELGRKANVETRAQSERKKRWRRSKGGPYSSASVPDKFVWEPVLFQFEHLAWFEFVVLEAVGFLECGHCGAIASGNDAEVVTRLDGDASGR